MPLKLMNGPQPSDAAEDAAVLLAVVDCAMTEEGLGDRTLTPEVQFGLGLILDAVRGLLKGI